MKNHIYEVDWNYPDVIESGDTTWRDLHQYVVVYDSNSELGKVIDEEIMDSDEAHIERVNQALTKSFGITDEDVVFYYGTSHEMTDEELKQAIRSDGELVITEIYGKTYEDLNWQKYLDYLGDWAKNHQGLAYVGMSPVCYDEFLENELNEEEK